MTIKNSIVSFFDFTTRIEIFYNGQKNIFLKSDKEFDLILNSLKTITKNSHDMPAFGVAIHNEVLRALKYGYWIELVFNNKNTFNNMPFESLLIEVNSEHTGFNLFRKVNGKYDGRCFYLTLNCNMKPLHDTLSFFELPTI